MITYVLRAVCLGIGAGLAFGGGLDDATGCSHPRLAGWLAVAGALIMFVVAIEAVVKPL